MALDKEDSESRGISHRRWRDTVNQDCFFYSATQHHLDSKAAKLQHGNDEERQMASDLRDISRKIDQGRFLY